MTSNPSRRSAVVVALLSVVLLGADWPQFLGPGGKSSSDATGLPAAWDAQTNLVWKTKLPGPGASCPIVIGEQIFITGYSGYGLTEDNPGEESNLRRYIACYRLADGTPVWNVPARAKLPETPYRGFEALHGYASSTPASDGESLFVFFGKTGVAGMTLDGKPRWASSVGTTTHEWGSGTSLLLHDNLLIVNASVESRSVVAFDKTSGREVWRVEGIDESWSTPALIATPEGATELVVSLKDRILGLDPTNGNRLWECQGITDYVCPTVLAHEGVAYVVGGRKGTTIAVRAGGRGDVTQTHRLWEIGRGSNVSSPVYHDGHLYWASESRGIVYCANAASGEIAFEERLTPRTGRIYASPLLADGKIYFVSREDGIFVLAAKPTFEFIGHVARMDESTHNASLVVGGGKLLLRSDEYLYCIGI